MIFWFGVWIVAIILVILFNKRISSFNSSGLVDTSGYTGSTGEKESKEDTGRRSGILPERCINCFGDCNICEEIN